MESRDGPPAADTGARKPQVTRVLATTGTRPDASAPPNSVAISVVGSSNRTDYSTLIAKPGTLPFQRGARDEFEIPYHDVGDPQFVEIQMDTGGAGQVR